MSSMVYVNDLIRVVNRIIEGVDFTEICLWYNIDYTKAEKILLSNVEQLPPDYRELFINSAINKGCRISIIDSAKMLAYCSSDEKFKLLYNATSKDVIRYRRIICMSRYLSNIDVRCKSANYDNNGEKLHYRKANQKFIV